MAAKYRKGIERSARYYAYAGDDVVTDRMLEAGIEQLADNAGVEAIWLAMWNARPKYLPWDVERFWNLVNQATPDACWLWKGAIKPDGYGLFCYRGRNRKAHIAAWEIHHGLQVPKGGVICHRCDNPPCCNPSHLWLGTPSENMKDMWRKGRARPGGLDMRGSRNPISILRESDIPVIRMLVRTGTTQTDVAKRFGVTLQAINRIIRGTAWQHVTEDHTNVDRNGAQDACPE